MLFLFIIFLTKIIILNELIGELANYSLLLLNLMNLHKQQHLKKFFKKQHHFNNCHLYQ